MAKVKITGHASGTGILTVTAPNTSTDRTITLPDATGTLLNSDGDGSNLTNLPADSTKLPLAGGTMTGTLTIEENMASDTQSTPETVASFGAKASSTGSDIAAGSGTRLELKIPSDDSPYAVTGTAIASIKEEGNETNSSSALAFYTSQNDTTLDEAVRITSEGYLTVPTKRQASFCARYSTNNSYSSGAIIILDKMDNDWFTWNYGSCYSTSTGKFTAPVDGVYQFHYGVLTSSWGDGDNTQDLIELISSRGQIGYDNMRTSQFRTDTYANGYYATAGTGQSYMTAGETMWIRTTKAMSVLNYHYSYFTGFLVG